MPAEIGYVDDEGRWCQLENWHDPAMPRISDRMRIVLYLFFDAEKPYELYIDAVHNTTDEEDRAFDAEVKMLREWLAGRGKVRS